MSVESHLVPSIAGTNGVSGADSCGKRSRIEELCEAISRYLQSHALSKTQFKYDDILEAAQLAFSTPNKHYSRYEGPISPVNRQISEALRLVTANSSEAAFVLDYSERWLQFVSGATPTTAWGLIDLIETAMWCIEEKEFSLLRMGRLLLLSYIGTRHTSISPQHALAMAVLLASLQQVQVKSCSQEVPVVVQLLLSVGQHEVPVFSVGEQDLEPLYWAENDYLRLAVNTVYGLQVPTLLKLINRPHISQGIFVRRGRSVLTNMDICELAALLLMSRSDPSNELDLGLRSIQLHNFLLAATTEYSKVDGPVLFIRNQLGVLVESIVWILALHGLPPPSCDNSSMRQVTSYGCESAVDILCTGTKTFSPRMCIGACLLLRSYARSVHALRTDQIVTMERTDQLCAALKRLLLEEPSEGVDEAVTGLLCNLLIDFSRLREPLIKLGIIPALGDALQRNSSHAMLVSVLWALRNACAVRDALDIEQLSFRTLDRVGFLRSLLTDEDMEVTRLFSAVLGNVSPANLDELHGMVGGRKRVVEYLAEQMENWQWPAVQEAASQALANLAIAVAPESGDDLLSPELCQVIVRCLQNPQAPQNLLANIGYMIANALLTPGVVSSTPFPHTTDRRGSDAMSLFRKARGSIMVQEGVYEALKQVNSATLSVRNSLAAARSAIEMITSDMKYK